MRFPRHGLIPTLCLGLGFAALPVRADGPLGTLGADARAKGMGVAQTAFSHGAASVYYNPANLPQQRKPTATFQLTSTMPMLDVELATPPNEKRFQPRQPSGQSGWVMGATFPVPDFWEERIVLGVVGYAPTATLTHADSPDPSTPFFYRYDSATNRLELEAALGAQLLDWLAVGGGVRLGAGQYGVMSISFDPLRQTMTRQELFAQQYGVLAPKAGLSLGPFDWGWGRLRFGAAYREKMAQTMTIFTHLELDGLDAYADMPAMATTNFSPRKVQLGSAFSWVVPTTEHAVWRWLVGEMHWAMDAVFAQWSEAPNPFLNLRTTIAGEGAEALGLVGNADVPGPGLSRTRPLELADTWNLHLGWEYELVNARLAMRLGYRWRPTPVPDQIHGTNVMDASAHVGSCGISGWIPVSYLAKKMQFDFSWQSQVLQRRGTSKVRADDPVGDWQISGAVHEMSVGTTFVF